MLKGQEKEREKERFKAVHTAMAVLSEYFEDVIVVCARPVDPWDNHPDQCIRWLQTGSEYAAEGMVRDLARAFDEARFVPSWSPGDVEEFDGDEIDEDDDDDNDTGGGGSDNSGDAAMKKE